MSGWELERSIRLGLLTAGFFLPVAIAIFIRVALTPAADDEPERDDALAPAACDPLRLEPLCPGGQVCVAGRCHDLALEPRCPAGEGCVATLCEPGLELDRGRCVAPEEVNLAAEACRGDVRWQETIRDMQRRCADERGEAQAPLTACEAALWERVNRSDEGFESALMDLPGTFSLHFPAGEPKRPGWPPPAIRGHYRAALAERQALLERARVILVIGRASTKSGSAEVNRAVAARRADLVVDMLGELLGPRAPIRHWALASDFALPPAEFQRPGHPMPIAWDPETTRALIQRLDLDGIRSELGDSAWEELSSVINQVVLVVPIECDGTEYFPRPSFRGRGDEFEERP